MAQRRSLESPLVEIFRSLARHRRISIIFLVAVMVLTGIVTLLMPKEYRSVGKLFVRLGRENATLDPTATLGQNAIVAMPQSRDNEINSVVEILQSRTLLEKVVDALGAEVVLNTGDRAGGAEETARRAGSWIGYIGQAGVSLAMQFSSSAGLDSRERAILTLAKNLKVEAAKKSNVIEIVYEGKTPERCQLVAAKLIDMYLDEHVRLNRTQGSHEFFVEQTERLRQELQEHENALRDLKKETGLAAPEAQRQMLVTRMGRLEDELLHTEASRAVAKAKLDELRAKLTELPQTEVVTETSGFGNEGTDRMREQFYALQVREKEAAAKYTDDHPKMKQIRDQIAAARAVLEGEERNRKQVTKGPDKLYQQAEAAALAEEPVLASLEAQTERLKTQLDDARRELGVLNDNELRIAALQREIDLLDADYRKYSNNLEQSRIDRELEDQRMSNIGIVQEASYEPRPIRPKKLFNLLMGMGFGVFGGLALPLAIDQFEELSAPVRRRRRGSGDYVVREVRHPVDAVIAESRRAPR